MLRQKLDWIRGAPNGSLVGWICVWRDRRLGWRHCWLLDLRSDFVTREQLKQINRIIGIWSMRPPPNSPEGRAWEAGCRQGWAWAIERMPAKTSKAK